MLASTSMIETANVILVAKENREVNTTENIVRMRASAGKELNYILFSN